MANQNSLILDQGYIGVGQILDPFAMRPYLNARGIPVVAQLVGVRTNADGSQSPVLKEKQVFKNALLRKYDWEMIDAEVLDIMRQPLVGISDLISAGLTRNLGGIGVSISTYEQVSDMSDANVSMSVTPFKGEYDAPGFTPVSIPVPIISKPFHIDIRTLDASRRNGHQGLDVDGVRIATIKVREKLEDMLFNGSTVQVDTFPIYGYTTLPQRDTATATAYGGGLWSAADANAHKTVVGMIGALNAKGYFGPFGLYVNTAQFTTILGLTGDGNNANTRLDVIQRTIPDLKFVRRAPDLDPGEAVLVQLTREVVDLAVGMDITPVSWAEYGGLINEFRIMGAIVPRVKYNGNLTAGVAHATGLQ